MCKEESYPGAVVVPGKLTNDSVWADVHPWEFSFLSSLMDPEGLFWDESNYSTATSVQKSMLPGDNDAVQLHCQGLGAGRGEEDVCPLHTSALASCFTVHAWLGSTFVGGFLLIHESIALCVCALNSFQSEMPWWQQYIRGKTVQILQTRQLISRLNLMFRNREKQLLLLFKHHFFYPRPCWFSWMAKQSSLIHRTSARMLAMTNSWRLSRQLCWVLNNMKRSTPFLISPENMQSPWNSEYSHECGFSLVLMGPVGVHRGNKIPITMCYL